jgi:hypothetical protein
MEPGGTLIFTAAQPGQGGVGHINCRKKEYWLNKFVAKGLIYHPGLTDDLIAFEKKGIHMGWFIRNVMIFKKH